MVHGVRRFWLLVAVVAAVVIWRVGEAHQTACVQAGQTNCSLLPWSGSTPGSGGNGGGGTLQSVGSSVQGAGGSIGGSISGSGRSVP
jgi:hypothetical protein